MSRASKWEQRKQMYKSSQATLLYYSEPPQIIPPNFAYIPPPSASLAQKLKPPGAFFQMIVTQIVIPPGPPSQASKNIYTPGGYNLGQIIVVYFFGFGGSERIRPTKTPPPVIVLTYPQRTKERQKSVILRKEKLFED